MTTSAAFIKKPGWVAGIVALVLSAACGSAVPATGGADSALCSPGSPPAQSADRFNEPATLTSTVSGVQYADLRVGCGALALRGRSVRFAYSFWLQNGLLVRTSRAAGAQPFSYTFGNSATQALPGFDACFINMRVGGKRRVVIPSGLAFGPQGAQGVPPNSVLIGDVALLSVTPPGP